MPQRSVAHETKTTDFARWSERRRFERLRERLSQPKENNTHASVFSGIGRAVNSPLAITLVSGLFVTVVTAHWQENNARQKAMEKTMVEFADQYGKLLNLYPTLKDRELKYRAIYLSNKQRETDGLVDDAKSTKELDTAERRYDTVLKQVVSLSNSDALTSRARAVFGSKTIDRECDELDQLTQDIGLTARIDVALERQAKALHVYKLIVQQMGSEMRK